MIMRDGEDNDDAASSPTTTRRGGIHHGSDPDPSSPFSSSGRRASPPLRPPALLVATAVFVFGAAAASAAAARPPIAVATAPPRSVVGSCRSSFVAVPSVGPGRRGPTSIQATVFASASASAAESSSSEGREEGAADAVAVGGGGVGGGGGGGGGGVRFLLSPHSLSHLSCIVGNFGKYAGSEWTMAKTTALAGASATSVALFFLAHAVATRFGLGYGGVEGIAAVVGAGLGWSLCGGAEVGVQESRRPDGGTLVKFVEDRPERLSHLVDRIGLVERDGAGDVGGVALVVVREGEEKAEGGATREEAEALVKKMHDHSYLSELRKAVGDAAEIGAPRRLRYEFARTMVDENSYEAALSSVRLWMDATRTAMLPPPPSPPAGENGGDDDASSPPVSFVLSRPPSHHATRRRGTGGCLLCSVAIAAKYALDGGPGASRVAILDVDAHHGNGVADCVQDDGRIVYCSIHERTDPASYRPEADGGDGEVARSSDPSDRGPRGNLLNVALDPGTTWEGEGGYRSALVDRAIPFLMGGGGGEGGDTPPDVLLVAAGFDALEADRTSSLALVPTDFERMGEVLKAEFGSRIVFGLEGGYTWQTGELGEAVLNLVKPWCGSGGGNGNGATRQQITNMK